MAKSPEPIPASPDAHRVWGGAQRRFSLVAWRVMTFETIIQHFTTRGLRGEDVRRYLDTGGDADRRDARMQWSLLHFAAEDRNPDVARLLVAHGADLAASDCNGWTPLHIAVDSDMDTSRQDGRRVAGLPTVQTLIELGAVETVRAADGRTPRDIAVAYGQEVLYDSLLRPKASRLDRQRRLSRPAA